MATAWLFTVWAVASGLLALAAGAQALFIYHREGRVSPPWWRAAWLLAGLYGGALLAALVLLIREAGR